MNHRKQLKCNVTALSIALTLLTRNPVWATNFVILQAMSYCEWWWCLGGFSVLVGLIGHTNDHWPFGLVIAQLPCVAQGVFGLRFLLWKLWYIVLFTTSYCNTSTESIVFGAISFLTSEHAPQSCGQMVTLICGCGFQSKKVCLHTLGCFTVNQSSPRCYDIMYVRVCGVI